MNSAPAAPSNAPPPAAPPSGAPPVGLPVGLPLAPPAAAGAAAGGAGTGAAAENARSRILRERYQKFFRTTNNFPASLPALPTGDYTAPLCDPIGYSQHGGECWSDTIQQLVLFSDGLKEYTQPYYYNTPFEAIAAKIDMFVDEPLREIVKQYVRAMQTRFINHYSVIKTRDPDLEVCVTAPDYRKVMARSDKFKLYRQHSFVSALESARSVVGWESEFSGAKLEQFQALFNILVGLTDSNFTIDLVLTSDLGVESSPFGYYLHTVAYSVDGLIDDSFFVKPRSGHALGIFQCGGNFYFYDDNTGTIQIDLPSSYIRHIKGILIDIKTNEIMFIIASDVRSDVTSNLLGQNPLYQVIFEGAKLWRSGSLVDLESISDETYTSILTLYMIRNIYALMRRAKRIYPLVPKSRLLTDAAPAAAANASAPGSSGGGRQKTRSGKRSRKMRRSRRRATLR